MNVMLLAVGVAVKFEMAVGAALAEKLAVENTSERLRLLVAAVGRGEAAVSKGVAQDSLSMVKTRVANELGPKMVTVVRPTVVIPTKLANSSILAASSVAITFDDCVVESERMTLAIAADAVAVMSRASRKRNRSEGAIFSFSVFLSSWAVF